MASVASVPPLWRQLQVVAGVLLAQRQGRSGTAALQAVESSLRPGVQALSFAVWRSLGRAQALRELLAKRAPPAAVDALLCVALALLWRDGAAPYDAHTLVDQTVQAAKNSLALRHHGAFLNACLRRFLRERAALLAQTQSQPLARWNHPNWWIEQLKRDWPEQWQDILSAADRAAPMVLRVNARHRSQSAYLACLHAAGMAARPLADQGVLLTCAVPVLQLPGFAAGWVSVQDAGAQRAAPLLLSGWQTAPPQRVLDACAAPGGKTAHLLELAELCVTALEIDASRCQRIEQNLQRLGLSAHLINADAADPSSWWDGQPYDAVLLDAPCSASGIVRRHPDIRWLRRADDIAKLAAYQSRLLACLWPVLKIGGRLLYCTCSVFRAEGEQQIEAFLASNKDAALLPSPGHLLPSSTELGASSMDNSAHEHDGFYYALLQKAAP